MSSLKHVNFSSRERANSELDEYSLDGYDPNYLGDAPSFEQFPPYTHKPKAPAYPLGLTKGKYFAFCEAPPRENWFCEFPHCPTTFLPYILWGTRHHCRACGMSVCIHHCSHNLTIPSNIFIPFEGDLEEINTPILATSLDGSMLPEVVTLKYVCLLCSDLAVTQAEHDRRKKKKLTANTREAEQLLLKLQAAQLALQEKSAEVHTLSTSVSTVTNKLHSMQHTIDSLENQVNKSANKEFRKVQKLKQQLRLLNAENERAMSKNNSPRRSKLTTNAANSNTNTTTDLRTVSFDSTSDEYSDTHHSDSDNYISDGESSEDSVSSTHSTTYIASNKLSPMRPIDQLYTDIINSTILTPNAGAAVNTTTFTTTEATQTTPYSLIEPINTNTSATLDRGVLSPAVTTTNTVDTADTVAKPTATVDKSSVGSYVRPSPITISSYNSATHNNYNTSNTPSITLHLSRAHSTSTPSPHGSYSPHTDITVHTARSIHTTQTHYTSRTSHTTGSAFVDYTDIYDKSSSRDSVQSDVFDGDYPEIRNINLSGDSQDSDLDEYHYKYKKSSFSAVSATSGVSAVSGISGLSGTSGGSRYLGGSGSVSNSNGANSIELDVYDPDIVDVYGTRYSSVFNLLEADLDSTSVSPITGGAENSVANSIMNSSSNKSLGGTVRNSPAKNFK